MQFAGSKREQIEELTAVLKEKGITIPGEERIGSAARKHEIRYFHDQDKKEATRIAELITSALRDLGYLASQLQPVTAISFTDYRSKKPRPGVIELWLELPYR